MALAESLDKPLPWAVGFFFGNTELSLELQMITNLLDIQAERFSSVYLLL